MPLAATTIEQIFARMHVRYTSKFVSNFAGMDMLAVKADWAAVLDNFSGEAIEYGLVNLPTAWPPNAAEFAEVCRRMPAPAPPKQLAFSVTPSVKAEGIATLRRLAENGLGDPNPRGWMDRLRERIKRGEHVPAFARACLAQATPEGSTDEERAALQKAMAETSRKVAAYMAERGMTR